MTAYQALAHAKLEAEQTILINGGSSAVGAFAIQIAKAKGAKVYTTASAKNEEYVRKLGADEVRIFFYHSVFNLVTITATLDSDVVHRLHQRVISGTPLQEPSLPEISRNL